MIGAEILKQLLKKWMLAHLEKNRVLQIFVVKMRTDVEECMNKLFGNRRQEGKGD